MDQLMMKAVICTKYGGPEVLKVEQIKKPIPRENEVLIKIKASAVNSGDVRTRSLGVSGFLKVIMRIVLGFKKPRKPVLGVVFSGIVEEIGKKVTNFKNGDEVFGVTGFKFGTHAEYIVLSSKSIIVPKPVNAAFEEAAAIPFGGHTAIYFLETAKIDSKSNLNLLIYGATGAVGTAAIQLAKFHNVNVTAVCSEGGENLVKELGADSVVLYDKEDFSQLKEEFDVVFDAVGKVSKKQCIHLLKKGGRFVTVGGLDVAAERKEQLELLKRLFEEGKYKAVIDRVYSIDEIVEAHRYVDTGRKKGNVVLTIS
jgi:NADPH:quinone reductase-like Zn-dependent oxidoreductase